jgi:hypothetical protein
MEVYGPKRKRVNTGRARKEAVKPITDAHWLKRISS